MILTLIKLRHMTLWITELSKTSDTRYRRQSTKTLQMLSLYMNSFSIQNKWVVFTWYTASISELLTRSTVLVATSPTSICMKLTTFALSSTSGPDVARWQNSVIVEQYGIMVSLPGLWPEMMTLMMMMLIMMTMIRMMSRMIIMVIMLLLIMMIIINY